MSDSINNIVGSGSSKTAIYDKIEHVKSNIIDLVEMLNAEFSAEYGLVVREQGRDTAYLGMLLDLIKELMQVESALFAKRSYFRDISEQ